VNLARERIAIGTAILAGGLALAACGDAATSARPSGGGNPSGPTTPTLEPPTSVGAVPSPSPPDETVPVSVDPALLAILPEAIDGIPVREDADAAALAQNDPALSQIATTVDAAVAVDTGTNNLVYVLVVQLRPGTFGGATYDQWRNSFDEGACAASDGVAGRAEATLGGRQAFITTCAKGIRTYHVLLEEQDVVISASSIGDGRFGETLMETLRVPA
jgi:hypothetical protein